MHPRNKMRLLAGVPMDPELERSLPTAKIDEQVETPLMKSGESLIDEGMDPYTALDGGIRAIQSVIKHLDQEIRSYHDNHDVAKVDKKDKAAYERVLALIHKGKMNAAKNAYRDMDTAARDHLSDQSVVTKKADRKAAATLFGYHLLHEGVGMDMLLGQKGKHFVNKTLNKIRGVDIEKGALTLYQMLRNKGREAADARHAAATTFGMDDQAFMDMLIDQGIHESEINEDHFEKGDSVEDKGGKTWKVTGSEGEGKDEVYELKGADGSTSKDVPGNLRKIDENSENIDAFLVEYQGMWSKVDKSLMEQLLELRKSQPQTAHRIISAARGHIQKGEIDQANEVISQALSMRESVHDYDDKYTSFEDDEEKPVNVADGSSNDEQIYDDMVDKDESPHQLMEPPSLGDADVSGYDKDKKMTVPSNITGSLRTEADKARKEAEKLDIRDKMAAQFYRDLARAFDDLREHLEKGTVYSVKQAQVFAQTLMGPMLHKIPTDVWKWLTNAGKTRSLKDYMKEVGNEAKLKKGFDPTKEKAA